MENDSIRASGTNTLVDIWIEGKIRAICVTSGAIGAAMGFDKAATLTDEARCDFVRTNLAQVVRAAKARLEETDPDTDAVTVDETHFARRAGASGDRRTNDRRKTDRRKGIGAKSDLAHPDRRRSDRRKGDRRSRSKDKPSS